MNKFLSVALTLMLGVVSYAQENNSSTENNTSNEDTTKIDVSEEQIDFAVSLQDLNEETGSQNISGLLQSTRDAYTSIAGFTFGAARFRIRGLGSENTITMVNGVNLNSPETGWSSFYLWSGLNDVTRYAESKNGISSNIYNFGGVGGYSNLNMRATNFRKGSRFSYAITNRSYRNRVMFTHSTGLMKNNMAITTSVSRRWAKEGYRPGTFYDAASYFLSIEKKLNDKHTLGIIGMGAPTIQGRAGLATQEAYDLAGSNYYNPYWGYQNGEKRNARVRNSHTPIIMLSHYFDINKTTQLNTSAYYLFGRYGNTNLNWYDASDPRPDYYKYLPSYYNQPGDEALYEMIKSNWENDENYRQIKWDDLYFANSKNLYTVNNADGINGNTIQGNRSKYIVEEYRSDKQIMGFNSNFNKQINENALLSSGLNVTLYKSKNFKVLEDLLGGDFWLDVDQFAERDFQDPNVAQNDINNPNNVVYEGDKFGYDYDININNVDFFTQLDYKLKKFDVFAAAKISNSSFWRTGNMINGKFPETSGGDSEKHSFFNFGGKLGIVYKLTGRHYFAANGLYMTRAPYAYTAFISPRTRHDVVDGLTSENVISGDFSYLVRYPNLKIRATVYHTEISNRIENKRFYHDEFNNFVNYIMTGVSQLHQGVEFGVDANITSTLQARGAFGTGFFVYNSRPTATISVDNSSELLAENRTVYLKNYRIGGMPQTAASVGLKYNAPKYWYVGVNFNYFDDIYISPNPDRRTEEALDKYVTGDPQWKDIVTQEKYPSGYTLDAYAGKSWRIKQKYYLRFNLNVNNVLNNTSLVTGGYEQLRYDANNIDKFPPKLSYMYGLSYFGMLSFLF